MIGTVLWENPNPTASFSAQEITLSSDNYDILEMYYTLLQNQQCIIRFPKGTGTYLMRTGGNNAVTSIIARIINYNTDTSYNVGNAYSCSIPSATQEESNTSLIPVKIIGYKLSIT